MYAKCGDLARAEEVLGSLAARDVVSWSALIAGYAKHDRGEEAWECARRMRSEGHSPNVITYIALLGVCSAMGSIEEGKRIHGELARKGLIGRNSRSRRSRSGRIDDDYDDDDDSVVIGNALLDMYAKCGELDEAEELLDGLAGSTDVVSWTMLISGYALHGRGETAVERFGAMLSEEDGAGISSPNSATFRSLLNACSHSGLVAEARAIFAGVKPALGTDPGPEHHACLVDVFGRAGLFAEALIVAEEMKCSDSAPIWGALLGACSRDGGPNALPVARMAFEHAVEIDPANGAAYRCMASIRAMPGTPD
jgi:pentatricopeptide repeat protein